MRGRVTSGSARLHQVIDKLFVNPVVTVPDLCDLLDVTYPTSRSDVDRLVEASILTEIEGSSHPKAYAAREILSIAYRDVSA